MAKAKKYCVLSQLKVKSKKDVKSLWAHNARLYTPRNSNPEDHYLNEYMIGRESDSYMDIFDRIVKEKNIKVKNNPTNPQNNSVLMLEYVTKFSYGTQIDLEAWKKQNQKFFEDTFGKENVISMIVHYDEASPHIHTVIIPTVKKKKKYKDGSTKEYWALDAKHFTGGYSAINGMVNRYAEYMKPFGLEKGKASKRDVARNEDIMKFYQEIDESANFQLPKASPDENVLNYIKRATPIIQEAAMNYIKKAYRWKKEMHDMELEIEEQKPLFEWASNLKDKGLIRRLLKLSEKELDALLPKEEVAEEELDVDISQTSTHR